jgi:hypothetical protein
MSHLFSMQSCYRGRLAPSPTGLLHLGHARTFWTAQQRAVAAGGKKIFGDIVIWRHDGAPSYQLAVVADDAAMQITRSRERGGLACFDRPADIALSRLGFEAAGILSLPAPDRQRRQASGQAGCRFELAHSARSESCPGNNPPILVTGHSNG